MSHHSDDNMLVASSDSFWEPGNYKRTTKRIEDGYKLCNDLITLIQERADIEKAYSKSLKGWAKKWNELIEKGPEYGTTEAAWKGALVEAERLCDVHNRVKDDLCNETIQQVKIWQKDTYHKTVLHIKERKEMEDAFKKAQKPWCKLLTKVNKTKNDYHNACKAERSAANQEKNAVNDTSLSSDQHRKMQDRVQKVKEEVQKGKEKYECALQELNTYNPKYMEDMTVVFDKCQEMEAQRLQFFKDVLFTVHKYLNISQDPVIPQIYEEFYHTINNADRDKDLKWWSNNHGINMAMNWPSFEEYIEEFRDISKGKIKEPLPAGNITLLNQRSVAEDLPDYSGTNNNKILAKKVNSSEKVITQNSAETKPNVNNHSNNQRLANDKSPQKNGPTTPNKNAAAFTNGTLRGGGELNPSLRGGGGGGGGELNPFEEEEWDEDMNDALIDNGEPGVPVRALYDYEGAESDELSFKQGEIFEKLEDEDEQGWCKGRKEGRVGLYPANYVEPSVP